MAQTQARDTKLDIRLTREAKARLNAAAKLRHQSLSQFVFKSALGRPDETLAERKHFTLSAEQWIAFLTALDAPPRPLPRLERLFQEVSLFETTEPE